MNLANELDLEMDKAIKRRLGVLFDEYFQTGDPEAFRNGVRQLEQTSSIMTKTIETL